MNEETSIEALCQDIWGRVIDGTGGSTDAIVVFCKCLAAAIFCSSIPDQRMDALEATIDLLKSYVPEEEGEQ